MKRLSHLVLSGFACLVLAAGLTNPPPAAASPIYRLTPLGSLPGHANSEAFGINNSGEVTGDAFGRAVLDVPFLYNGSKMVPLGVAQGAGQGINSRGQIAGQADGEAFFYNGTTVILLGSVPGGKARSNALGINDSGEVVGENYGPETRAFLYNGKTVVDLGTLKGGKFAGATAINDDGEITGTSDVGNGHGHAFLDNGKTMLDLGTLGGSDSAGSAINAAGEVAGWSNIKGNTAHRAFLYNGTKMVDLGALPGDADSIGAAINDAGDVVGWSTSPAGVNHGFLYDSSGIHDLNKLIDPSDTFLLANPSFVFDEATGINDEGQIAGDGYFTGKGGQTVFEAFILTPEAAVAAPEPASLPLLAGGVIALFFVRPRKLG